MQCNTETVRLHSVVNILNCVVRQFHSGITVSYIVPTATVCSGVSLSTRHDATLSCRDHPPSLQLCSANRTHTHQLYSSHLCTPLDARRLCVPRGCDKGLELLAAVRPERFFNRHLPSRTRDFLPHATTRVVNAAYAVARCLSVRLSVCLVVCHIRVLYQNK